MARFIKVGGFLRPSGYIPRARQVGPPRFALLADRITILPRDQWRPIDLSRDNPEDMAQRRSNCTSFATIQTYHIARKQSGLPFIEFSPGSLYPRVNGGADQGSTLLDNLIALIDGGICPSKDVPDLDAWRIRDLPANWKSIAKNYRATEAWDCPDFAAQATCLTRGDPTIFGILVGNAFEPGRDGWIPYERAADGHAMCGQGLVCRPQCGTRWATIPTLNAEYHIALLEAITQNAVDWGIKTPNSWNNWGIPDARGHHYGIVPETYFTSSPFDDGWGLRVVTQAESTPPNHVT